MSTEATLNHQSDEPINLQSAPKSVLKDWIKPFIVEKVGDPEISIISTKYLDACACDNFAEWKEVHISRRRISIANALMDLYPDLVQELNGKGERTHIFYRRKADLLSQN